MSDKKRSDAPFTNEDTIVRRAWIETALASVRSRLGSQYPDPDAATAGTGIDGSSPANDAEQNDSDRPALEPAAARRSGLYVAWSAPARRSGT